MHVKSDTDLSDFLKAVQRCGEDVYFISPEGDQLNLHSAFSQFLFLMLQSQPGVIQRGRIQCGEGDAEWLSPYFEPAVQPE